METLLKTEEQAVAAAKPAPHAAQAELRTLSAGREAAYCYTRKPVYEALKRAMDVVLAAGGIVLASPIMLATAIAIKWEDGGPVMYTSTRIGRHGKPFKIYKFRSMKPNADRLEDILTPEQLAEYKKDYKIKNDPRITKVGNFIRKTSIDEIPQFVNVLSGSLSMVGPRPVLQEETELYGKYRDIFLSVRPGLTGYWQVNARNDVSYENFARQDMELTYVTIRSFRLDVKILFQTVGEVLRERGA